MHSAEIKHPLQQVSGGACSLGVGGLLWGVCSQGVILLGGSAPGGCLVETPGKATAAGGTHPT